MTRQASFALAILSVFQGLSCSSMPRYLEERGCRDLNKKYIFGVESSQRAAVFEALEMPLQYDVFVCAMESVHPAELLLLNPLASRGEHVVPFLRHELEVEVRDVTVLNLIRVFARMDRLGSYRILEDQDLAVLLERRARSISDPLFRALALDILQTLET